MDERPRSVLGLMSLHQTQQYHSNTGHGAPRCEQITALRSPLVHSLPVLSPVGADRQLCVEITGHATTPGPVLELFCYLGGLRPHVVESH